MWWFGRGWLLPKETELLKWTGLQVMKLGFIEWSWYVTSQYISTFSCLFYMSNGVDCITTSDNWILGSLRRFNTSRLMLCISVTKRSTRKLNYYHSNTLHTSTWRRRSVECTRRRRRAARPGWRTASLTRGRASYSAWSCTGDWSVRTERHNTGPWAVNNVKTAHALPSAILNIIIIIFR